MEYRIRRTGARPELEGRWGGPAWRRADTVDVAVFRPEGSDHRPQTRARLLYDDQALYGIFRVRDRYVRSVRTKFHDNVCKDSCVEFFVQPDRGIGYFNFEFNCGGVMLCYYVSDPKRTRTGFRKSEPLPIRLCKRVGVHHSMPRTVAPEIEKPTVWTLEFAIPFGVFEWRTGPLGDLAGRCWRANFYKCGDETSHPHWVSWTPLTAKNFHLPQCFGTVRFAQ